MDDRTHYGRPQFYSAVRRDQRLRGRRAAGGRSAAELTATPEAVVAQHGCKLAQLDLNRQRREEKTYQRRLEAAQIADTRESRTRVKHRKVEADDIRNFSRRDPLFTMDDARTSTKIAAWPVIAGERKWCAQVCSIEAAVAVLGDALERGPLPVDKAGGENSPQASGEKESAALGFAAYKAK